ncbi:MAG: hypothetical protein QS2022_8440 [Candidatus Phytoplasma asteris]|nr:MAG: hypothetical protein PLY_8390 [Periwinkle leaf yellowing phytoplasma]WEX20052.1 MAG: hypothetical protein QS2022_8440 [Candidatus Phytoplasma asteris]
MYLQLIYPAQIKINKEAMNCGGKVDIKVDFDDFVYIAECKMFDKVLNKDMENIDHVCDQLMNYTNGQNKEGAISLFNKNSNFARQIKTIEKWIKDKHKLEPNNCKGPNPNSWVVPIKHVNGHDFTLYIACYNLSSFVSESKKHEKQKDVGIKTVSSHKEGNIQSNEGIQENLTKNKQGEQNQVLDINRGTSNNANVSQGKGK